MDKFLILGGNSRLGRCFYDLYPKISQKISKAECDINDIKAVEKILKKSKAKYILNCAAITDIEKCEKKLTKCLQVNTVSVYNLEKACQKYGKKLIQISSDYALNPINIYGLSKHLSEQILDRKKTLIIRTSFYSKDTYLISNLLSKKNTNAYTNMFFNPVSINRLAAEIYQTRKKKGVINIFSLRKISKYKFALYACRVFNISPTKVKKVMFKNKPGFAKRPYSSYIKSDIPVTLKIDLEEFKKYLQS